MRRSSDRGDGEQPERVVLAQVVLDGELALAERRAADALDRRREALALERFDLVARRALNRGVHGLASSPRGCGSAPG